MAFKKIQPAGFVPDSPEKLFLDLPRRKISGVYSYQQTIMQQYSSTALNLPDVALQLPTGSGKTLVGLLIAEWRRRKYKERVVFLCPTKQLVNQVAEQAEDQYGISVLSFTGKAEKYDIKAKAEYKNADKIAVTTYSSLFNNSPFFDDPDVIIIDDAHSAENYVASMWSFSVERFNSQHSTLHIALCILLKNFLDSTAYARITGEWNGPENAYWVDKIPTPIFYEIKDKLIELIDTHVSGTDLSYSWSRLRGHLLACHMYLSSKEILIRPMIAPTWTHSPFFKAKQRIYMSATLGAGGDLERLMGRNSITRLPSPEDLDCQGVGRRFFIFPEMYLENHEVITLRQELMLISGRSLVLVPSEKIRKEIEEDITEKLGFKIFGADDIEKSKKLFINEEKAVTLVSNRYDGIDFSGDECRLLFIEGLPNATNLQERFLMSRMSAIVLFNERVQTRVLQAIGRCTRSLADYSAIVVSGGELPDYITDNRRINFFHPELQAEIKFGIEQSKESSVEDIVENFKTFLDNGKSWEEVNRQILEEREKSTRNDFPAIEELQTVVSNEINFQKNLWKSDYEGALVQAELVLSELSSVDLKGYRALWHYLAGSAAWLGSKENVPGLLIKATKHFNDAKNIAPEVPWLVKLARYQKISTSLEESDSLTMLQIENVESIFTDIGTVNDRKFCLKEKEILGGLELKGKNSGQFENSQKILGELLGFNAGKEESDGSPDPWWIVGDKCIVFEDFVGCEDSTVLSVTKARQVSAHPAWMRVNVKQSEKMDILPVLVSPITQATIGAKPPLKNVAFWLESDYKKWAINSLHVLREIRTSFVEPGDLQWRSFAAEKFRQNHLDVSSLYEEIKSRQADKQLLFK